MIGIVNHEVSYVDYVQWEVYADLVAHLVTPCAERGLACKLYEDTGKGPAVVMRRLP